MIRKMILASAVLAAFGATAHVAQAEELIEEYNAYIGEEDLYNSDGGRLTQPWQIIRQDRANYHKFGVSQPGDDDDNFFASAKNRALVEKMIQRGSIDRQAARRLAKGDVSVSVQIWRGDDGDFVNINVE
ncbi:hypothetical protein [Pararhizobium sp.]|uniref:hypothetical protein n=1 Tax=Pararhizobium sp. TaxID=1977563 RepID=UPI002718921D|nr:hypothetical protein [Pararhizobium sp.]MDO9418959.1 hypothetical protein [Pararhizobium sp.]